jgi:transposase
VLGLALAERGRNQTVFTAWFHRWAKRLPKKKALVAVAHKTLVVIWHVLKKKAEYKEQCQVAQPA